MSKKRNKRRNKKKRRTNNTKATEGLNHHQDTEIWASTPTRQDSVVDERIESQMPTLTPRRQDSVIDSPTQIQMQRQALTPRRHTPIPRHWTTAFHRILISSRTPNPLQQPIAPDHLRSLDDRLIRNPIPEGPVILRLIDRLANGGFLDFLRDIEQQRYPLIDIPFVVQACEKADEFTQGRQERFEREVEEVRAGLRGMGEMLEGVGRALEIASREFAVLRDVFEGVVYGGGEMLLQEGSRDAENTGELLAAGVETHEAYVKVMLQMAILMIDVERKRQTDCRFGWRVDMDVRTSKLLFRRVELKKEGDRVVER